MWINPSFPLKLRKQKNIIFFSMSTSTVFQSIYHTFLIKRFQTTPTLKVAKAVRTKVQGLSPTHGKKSSV
jgi:hypothetical protein